MKNFPVEITVPARLDLLDIWNHIAEEASIDVADMLFLDIDAALKTIARFPDIGQKRTDLTKRPLRFYRVHSYFIAYSHEVQIIRIARVIHAARDIRTEFAE